MLMNEDLARDRMREFQSAAEQYRLARRQQADPRSSKMNRRSLRNRLFPR